MKALKIFLVILFILIYAYSAYKASFDLADKSWGIMCAIIFAGLFIYSVYEFVKKENKNS